MTHPAGKCEGEKGLFSDTNLCNAKSNKKARKNKTEKINTIAKIYSKQQKNI